ncbi:MAG: alkaline phosphatase family protein, partial [Proteobacteria bacterium]|nr:alkaline phosphatase family protein [Pseudomonadota bacterium]
VALTLETIRHRRHVGLAAIKEMINAGHLDALFLYFEDIDVILHAWIGLSQYDSQLTDFLQEFDQEIGQLIASLSEDTNLVVMGDHGMSAVQYELNVRKLLPAGAAQSFQIRSSGGSLLLYPAGPLNTEVPAGLNLAGVAQSLREVTVEFDHHRKVFRRVILRDSDEARSLGLSGPSSPWIMAFADEGIALTDKLDQELLVSRRETFLIPQDLQAKYPDPMNSGRLVQPTPLGAHGHDSELSSMRTSLILLGPNLGGIDGSSLVSTVDVVPAVAEALGWVRPAACL